MKKIILALCFCVCVGAVYAGPTLYTETVGVQRWIWDSIGGSWNTNATWSHGNPTSSVLTGTEYDLAALSGQITDVSLTIKVGGLSASDKVGITFTAADSSVNFLGYLDGSPTYWDETTFTLDAGWLNGVDVEASIDWTFSHWFDLIDTAFIKTATLSLTYDDEFIRDAGNGANIVPAPGALLLGSMGMGLVGWLRRRNTI